MKTIHSIFAAFVLIAIAMVVFNAIMSLKKEEKFKGGDRKLGLIALILTHTQFLIGLITYYVSPWYKSLKVIGMGNAMKEKTMRLLTVEHPFTMILAIALITVGWSRHKKMADNDHAKKFKSFAIFYGIGLVLILARIPWKQWI